MEIFALLKTVWAFRWPALVVVAGVAGLLGGIRLEENSNKAKIAEQQQEARVQLERQVSSDAIRAVELSAQISEENARTAARLDALKPKVRKALSNKKVTHEEVGRGIGDLVLDADALRVLNAARSNTDLPAASAAGNSDGQSGTTPAP